MKFNIRNKLFAGFGAVLLLLAVVAGLGLVKLNETTADLHRVSAVELQAVQAVLEAKADVVSMQSNLREQIATSDANATTEAKASYATAEKDFTDQSQRLQGLFSTSEGKAKLAQLTNAYATWAPTRTKAADLLGQGQRDAASQLLVGADNMKAETAVKTAIEDVATYKKQDAATFTSTAEAAAEQARIIIIGTFVLALILGGGIALFLSSAITSGINKVVKASQKIAGEELPSFVRVAKALAAGDLTQDVAITSEHVHVASKDEIGLLANDFNRIVDALQETGEAFSEMRQGLNQMVGQIQGSANGIAGASDQLGQASGQTGAAVQQVSQAIQNVAAGAQDSARSAQTTNEAVQQLSKVIDSIASGATEQARQVQAVSATATQMAAGVQQVAANADTVANASRQTKEAAESGAQAVQETVAGMEDIRDVVGRAAGKVEELGKLGEKIGAVVETIDDIAEQTNLLALNAAIEAARAGEHGMGFAVVADEVRKLAERSQRETKAIADLIQEVQAGTQEAVRAMESGSSKVEQGSAKADQAGKALVDILQAVEATVQQVNDIAAAAQEMASSSGSVVEAMQSIHTVVEQNTAATEEMAAQAGQVLESIQAIAAANEEQSAATEEVSASAEEMSAQVEEISAQAEELAATAEELKALVARFRVDDEVRSNVIPLRKAA